MDYPDALGSVWYETEVDGWQGKWTRIAGTNEFSAEFTHPSGQRIGGRLSIRVDGRTVRIHRENPGTWGTCEYLGTLSPDLKTVSGNYHCTDQNNQPTPTYAWSARIE
ncbi:hypothetical protein [Nocardia sp. CA-119907]|uniref:hypothetical protein n=1 Tax=Nocardia sp. CA-119907 TaxID=3239973 RepID=UPI003D99735F